METQLLRNPEVYPFAETLRAALGNSVYEVFELLKNDVTGADFGLTYDWHYYNDGKAWLCKVADRKKTIFWLSVWDTHFQAAFYFTEKYSEKIAALDTDATVKEEFSIRKTTGKLLPLIFRVSRREQLNDLMKVVKLKKSLK